MPTCVVRIALAAFILAAAGGCASSIKDVTRTRVFPTERIESELVVGVSTRADVERVLGKPDGVGGLLLPGMPAADDAWFYQRSQLTTARTDASSLPHFEAQTDIVVIFFRNDRFDGFLCFSDADGTW